MAEETTIIEIEGVESFAALYPELHSEVFAAGKTEGIAEGITEGKNAERALFAELKESCGDDHELLAQCFSEGKTAAEAMKLRAEKLGQENTKLTEQVTDLQKKRKSVDPADLEFSDTATSPGGGEEGKDKNEEALKREFAESKDLQAEYGNDVNAYIAFKKADADGNVRIAHQA